MKTRKPQNVGRKITQAVEEKREEPPLPNPIQQTSPAFQKQRKAAQVRLRDEVIFPETELTPKAVAEVRARADENCKAYRERMKEHLKASKGKARIVQSDYLEWLREKLQKAHPDKRVPKRSAKGLAPFLPHFDWRFAGIVPSVRNQKKMWRVLGVCGGSSI